MLPSIPRPAWYAVAVIAVALLAFSGRAYTEKLAVAQSDAASARAVATQALQHAADATSLASAFRAKANLLADSAAAATRLADLAEQKSVRLRGSFTATAATAPDTCRLVILAADSALVVQDSAITTLHTALQSAQDARLALTAALDTTTAALAALRVSGTALVHADAALSHAARPSLFTRLLPHPGIGVAIILDPTGTPRVGVGLALSWPL
jgi:hypothetical protein